MQQLQLKDSTALVNVNHMIRQHVVEWTHIGFNTDTAYDHYRLNWYKIMSTRLLGNPPVCSIEASITGSRVLKMGSWQLHGNLSF